MGIVRAHNQPGCEPRATSGAAGEAPGEASVVTSGGRRSWATVQSRLEELKTLKEKEQQPVHRNIGPRVAAGHKSLKINGANVADADVQLEA